VEKLFDYLSFGCDFEKIFLTSVKKISVRAFLFVLIIKFYILNVWLAELNPFRFLTTSFFFVLFK